MKKQVLLAVSVILVANVFAQENKPGSSSETTTEVKAEEPNDGVIKKGTILLGSYFNFSTSSTSKTRIRGNNTESSQVTLGGNVTAGKMIRDHWGILVNAGYVSVRNITPTTSAGVSYDLENDRHEFQIAPSLRYYTLVSEGTYFFLQSTVSLTFGTLGADELDRLNNVVHYDYNTNGYGVSLSPGVTYFMTKKLSTEIAIGVLGYSYLSGSDKLGNKTETSTFQSLFYLNSVSLGFVYYF